MRIMFVLFFAALSGCVTQGKNTTQYNKNESVNIINEKTVNMPYSKVWDILVRDLAKSFYVINNIDKESRIVNVSFNSTEPADFVDCGRTVRTYSEGKNVERYEYDVAGKSTFKVATPRQEHPSLYNYAVINRDSDLEGRANIYIAPSDSDPNKTTASVNTRYILKVRVKGELFAKDVSGNIYPRGVIPEESSTYTFNTNSVATKDAGHGTTITCFSKGKLESDILNIVLENQQ